MANNFDITEGSGKTIRSVDKGGVQTQPLIVDLGGAGAENLLVGGRQADADSLPVALSSEDVALIGATNEASAAADNSTSGLNGLVKRLLARLTTLLNGGLPAALGGGGGLKVDGSGTALPVSLASAPTTAVTIADAADATLGAKADAKSTATDTTAITIMQVLKQISASVQSFVTLLAAGLPSALTGAGELKIGIADGSNVVEGVTNGAAVITDSNGTHQQYLRGLIKQWIAGTLTFASQAYASRVQVTRPSNTTAYAANDVVGATGGGTASMTFAVGAGAGEYMITSARLQRNATALISGEASYILHLYNVTQPAAQVDNDAFDIVSGDQASYLGSINLGTPVDLGSTLEVEVNGINKQVTLASANLYGVLVTVGAYTPVSAAVHVVELHTIKL